MNNIILCGFMGCGKTTVGRLLAARTGRQFTDMDDWIEQRAGMTVREIFDRFGEDDFRRREREACRELAGGSGLVVAAGGGALTFPENAAALAATGEIVLLEVTPETVLRRLAGDTTRPLLARKDKEEAVRQLLAARLPSYRLAAGLAVSGEGKPAEVAEAVLAALREKMANGCPERRPQ